jgi:hypothetical protein
VLRERARPSLASHCGSRLTIRDDRAALRSRIPSFSKQISGTHSGRATAFTMGPPSTPEGLEPNTRTGLRGELPSAKEKRVANRSQSYRSRVVHGFGLIPRGAYAANGDPRTELSRRTDTLLVPRRAPSAWWFGAAPGRDWLGTTVLPPRRSRSESGSIDHRPK